MNLWDEIEEQRQDYLKTLASASVSFMRVVGEAKEATMLSAEATAVKLDGVIWDLQRIRNDLKETGMINKHVMNDVTQLSALEYNGAAPLGLFTEEDSVNYVPEAQTYLNQSTNYSLIQRGMLSCTMLADMNDALLSKASTLDPVDSDTFYNVSVVNDECLRMLSARDTILENVMSAGDRAAINSAITDIRDHDLNGQEKVVIDMLSATDHNEVWVGSGECNYLVPNALTTLSCNDGYEAVEEAITKSMEVDGRFKEWAMKNISLLSDDNIVDLMQMDNRIQHLATAAGLVYGYNLALLSKLQ